jgi:hypothetical protein
VSPELSGLNYWVFVAPSWAKMHKSGCRHCNGGKGQRNQDKREPRAATEWVSFITREDAANFMANQSTRYRAIATCLVCKP